MQPIRAFPPERDECLRPRRYARPIVAITVGVCCLAAAASAAQAAAGLVPVKGFPATQVFTLLFLMLGPFKIIGPFADLTKGADSALTRRIALRAILFSTLALLIAAFLGQSVLEGYGIPVPILALAGGIILFLVALQHVLQQFTPPAPHADGRAGAAPPPELSVALTPLAFPTIVTPYGVAALVVIVALSPGIESRLVIGAILVVIMLLNLLVMIAARRVLSVLGILLPILGAVLGVVQVALGLQVINNSLRTLGVL